LSAHTSIRILNEKYEYFVSREKENNNLRNRLSQGKKNVI